MHKAIPFLILLSSAGLAAAPGPALDPAHGADTLEHVASAPALKPVSGDGSIRLTMHPPVVLMRGDGRQPYLFCTPQGTLFCQAQLNLAAFHTKKKEVYHARIATAVSRDLGATWQPWTHEADHDDVFIEGGAAALADGTLLLLDTFIMPGARPDRGVGELWRSRDDLRTLEGPLDVDFHLPQVRWSGSTGDNGMAHTSARLHRSLVELPNGDLITLLYSRWAGDTAPSAYMPTMMKSRVVVARSRDRGRSFEYLSTVAVDSGIGTEGYGEPVIERVPAGRHAGRLICLMRTGRDLYGCHSDDDGATWSRPAPVDLPGIDVYDTGKWTSRFVDTKAPDYVPTDEMIGAVVDPDLVAMRDGTLVAALGVRIPARKYRYDWRTPQNGDCLAFSRDGGDTWSTIVQFLSGSPTTHYMGVREVKPGLLYVVYDDSVWNMVGETMGFQLEVAAGPAPAAAGPVLKAEVQSLVDRRHFAGAVALVASGERVLETAAAGSADLAAGKAMREDAVFWIASMSKSFTASAVMMLVDEGRLRVDDPVEKYLPDFKDLRIRETDRDGREFLRRPAHPITIKNLLTHTSGLVPRSPLEIPHIDLLSLRDNVRLYPLVPLGFEPGSRYQYSNAGVNTAGRIVEVVSGMSFEDFMQRRLFTPLGMRDTTFWPDAGQVARLAKSYRAVPGRAGWEEVLIDQLSYPLTDRRRGVCPAGGLFSTAADVSLYCRMLLGRGSFEGRTYLTPASVAEMATVHTGEFPIDGQDDAGYGYGLTVARKVPGRPAPANLGTYGHGGAYATSMTIDPVHQLVTVLMVQRAEMPREEGAEARRELRQAALADCARRPR